MLSALLDSKITVHSQAMQTEPQFERIGAALADISRKRMLCALMDGRAHTGKELSLTAGVTAGTASSHLAMLRDTGLITSDKIGRSTYHRLNGPDVAALLEGLSALVPPSFAARLRAMRRTDPESLHARCCYDHIAGALGVGLCDVFLAQHAVVFEAGAIRAGAAAAILFKLAGIDPKQGEVVGRSCLDWSERRPHLAGDLGRALLRTWLSKGWLHRMPSGRGLVVAEAGRHVIDELGLTQKLKLTDASFTTEVSML